MIVLALDTATPQVGVALAGPDGPLASLQVRDARRHGELLAPAVETVCRCAGVTLADVGLVAVDLGPGLFTGLRVGLATAMALGSALDVPAVGCTSTEILAAAHAGAGRPVAAVVDIRRREVAWGLYEPSPAGMIEVRGPQRAAPEDLRGLLEAAGRGAGAGAGGGGGGGGGGAGVLAVGDGARRYAADLGKVAIGDAVTAHPSPAVLAQVARERAGAAVPAASLVPCYLREADVRIGWEQGPRRG